MNNDISSAIVYSNFKAAAAAVCQRWCHTHGYSDCFYQDGSWWAFPFWGVIPIKLKDVIDRDVTKAQRVQIKHYSIALSVALLPDGCVAPYNHPEL